MANKTIGISDELAAYVVEVGTREPDVLARLREETAALPQHGMQIAPEQGAFLALLVELIGARRCIEVGTFTGYSSTAVALALPDDGQLRVLRRLRGVDLDGPQVLGRGRRRGQDRPAHRARRRDARPAARGRRGGRFDFAFVDADKAGYDGYYERLLRLVRPGGLIALDNTLWSGAVLDEDATDDDTVALQALNAKLATDERITVCLLPIADGVTLARRR